MRYKAQIAEVAAQKLRELDRGTRRTVLNKIHDLEHDPEQRGKPLAAELAGFRSIHAAGRYRIVYYVKRDVVVVVVVGIGIRKEGDKKDIYEVMKKLIRAGLIE